METFLLNQAAVLPHPVKTIISAEAMQTLIDEGGSLAQRKYDGVLARRKFGMATLLGELVSARSGAFLTAADKDLIAKHGSFFAAFTVEDVAGQNFLIASTRTRNAILRGLADGFEGDLILAETVSDVSATMAGGAEGVCLHHWDAAWSTGMLCHKASSIHECRITAIGGTQSVEVLVLATGATCRVTLAGGKVDQVRIGSVIRVECLNVTDSGRLYQPRPCREWLKQF